MAVGLQPQFLGGGPAVRVRNTFLDCDDDNVRKPDVARASTEPPPELDRSREPRQEMLQREPASAPAPAVEGLSQEPDADKRGASLLTVQPTSQPAQAKQQPKHSPPSMPSSSQSCRIGNHHSQPQTLSCHYDSHGARYHTHWVVDARKLYGNDKQVVSPPFDICLGSLLPRVTFKLMICPKAPHDVRGGAAFKKSGGRGFMQLKCEEDVTHAPAYVSFSLTIASSSRTEPIRGPVSHNFAKRAVCGLLKSQELWDFGAVVDTASMTFNVLLEILPLPIEAHLVQEPL